MLFKAENDEKLIVYKKMQSLVDTLSMISITRDSWRDIQMLWQQMELFVSFFIHFLNERTEFCVLQFLLGNIIYSSLDATLVLVFGFGITRGIR